MSIACPWPLVEGLALCQSVDIYCERTSALFDAEPLNATSNLAFIVAAWLAQRAYARLPDERRSGLLSALVATLAVVGFGSFLFHTIATQWAEWGDVIPILVFVLLYLWLALTRFFLWPVWRACIAVLVFLGLTLWLETGVPSEVLWGGAMYLPSLLALLIVGAALYHQRHAAGKTILAATGTFLASFAARTADMPLCSAVPFGTHFMWHVLNAIVLYLLIRAAVVEAAHGDPQRAAAGPLIFRRSAD